MGKPVATSFPFQRISYDDLTSRQQKKIFNSQKVAGVLADFGFTTRLTDDQDGVDFLSQHQTGDTLKVQLKGRLWFEKSFCGRDLWVCFRDQDIWYLYPHDQLLELLLAETNIIAGTSSWEDDGRYHFPSLSGTVRPLLEPYRLTTTPWRTRQMTTSLHYSVEILQPCSFHDVPKPRVPVSRAEGVPWTVARLRHGNALPPDRKKGPGWL